MVMALLMLGLPLHKTVVLGMRCLHVDSALFLRKIVKDESILSGKMGAYFR